MTEEQRQEVARQQMDQLIQGSQDNNPLHTWLSKFHPWEVIQTLQQFISEERMQRITNVVQNRTRSIVPVIDGLVNTGNVSAVLRSAEALGYQDIHVIVRDEIFKQSERTSQGAEKWLDLYSWTRPEDCIQYLRKQGYNTVALFLDEDAKPLADIDFTRPTALIFGNEEGGVSEEVLQQVDEKAILPMSGFTESFNVSVAAALTMYHIRDHRQRKQGYHADLTVSEQTELIARFCLYSLRGGDKILERLL